MIRVLENTSVLFDEAKINFIIGPSGSGKTTLLRLIAGFEKPDDGQIFIGDECVSSPTYIAKPYRRNVGFVFQSPTLWPHMNVKRNITYGLVGKYKKDRIEEKADEILELLNIINLKKRMPSELSGGQAQRVSIARTLVMDYPIILLDEPLSHLDSNLREQIFKIFLAYVLRPNKLLVYVTHSDSDRDVMPSECAFFMLKDGKIVSNLNRG